MKLAIRSASVDGDSTDWIAFASSAGACGNSETASAGEALQVQRARFDLAGVVRSLGQVFDARDHEGQAVLPVEHAEAALALHDEVMRAVLAGHIAHDARDRADLVRSLPGRRLQVRIVLQQETDLALGAHGFLRGRQRALAIDRHRARRCRGTAPGCAPAR